LLTIPPAAITRNKTRIVSLFVFINRFSEGGYMLYFPFLLYSIIFLIPFFLYTHSLHIPFEIMHLIRTHRLRERHCLWNEIFVMSRFAIIIRPAVHGRNLAWPVAMDVFYRSSPLQCICSPWILDSFFTFPDRTEEID